MHGDFFYFFVNPLKQTTSQPNFNFFLKPESEYLSEYRTIHLFCVRDSKQWVALVLGVHIDVNLTS